MTITDVNLYSVGKLAELYQSPPSAIRRAAERAGVRPALSLNDIAHYDEDALEAIRAALVGNRTRVMA